ncbi:DUF1788 domain-containing protein [Alkalimarinus alittae]|uniref:DUF1788 domain-containing protein n=1 Tax=Alkalimarinus alittae TaxID=2961619 RepID=A0ABY6MX82_9ALTE|nr:DUF1788 domain-containing protein [Alkalimarinus alittae]UZE94433.1 DUF1788 domain-containing protein [Alkalimarinus alittae]
MSQVSNTPTRLNTVSAKNLAEVQSHLLNVIASQRFLKNEGLNNEVPFHICPFEPDISQDMSHAIKQLKNELRDKDVGVLEINLYDLVIEILKDEGDWEWLMENETSLSRNELKEELQGILDTESVLIPAIVTKMKAASYDVIFISGVGEVFPYIRSHNILNNLQRVAKEQPTLMFFPGKYQHSLASGASLRLFDKLTDDKYYRAFNILDRAN